MCVAMSGLCSRQIRPCDRRYEPPRIQARAPPRRAQGGQRLQITCFPNYVLSWRYNFEKDLDELIQYHNFYSNVSPKYASRYWRKASSKFLARRGSGKVQSGRSTPGRSASSNKLGQVILEGTRSVLVFRFSYPCSRNFFRCVY
ncbi:uncharacterized protein LOC124649875 isoform X2 [Lolium rigidum]|uniref:uncharacterized protein LOC124649875 isoform X2 n=2 Tax=Lolium rigidum TaxID=89674 RepID=UPI001F5C8DD3|nr:uncharacterized protein LOC124649875 isoform X2 [Lolium rigidum]